MAIKSMMLRAPLKNCHLFGEDANRRMYSRVNHVMQTTSTKSSFSLSFGLPFASMPWNSGSVLRVSPMVDTIMKAMLSTATTFRVIEKKANDKTKIKKMMKH